MQRNAALYEEERANGTRFTKISDLHRRVLLIADPNFQFYQFPDHQSYLNYQDESDEDSEDDEFETAQFEDNKPTEGDMQFQVNNTPYPGPSSRNFSGNNNFNIFYGKLFVR